MDIYKFGSLFRGLVARIRVHNLLYVFQKKKKIYSLGELDHVLLPGDLLYSGGEHCVPGLVLAQVPGLGWPPVLLWPQRFTAGQGLNTTRN